MVEVGAGECEAELELELVSSNDEVDAAFGSVSVGWGRKWAIKVSESAPGIFLLICKVITNNKM